MRARRLVGTVLFVQEDAPRRSLQERIRQMPPWQVDAVLATLFVVTAFLTTRRPDFGYEERDAAANALILAATVPYYARRLAPLPVLMVSISAIAALFLDGYDAGALPFLVGVGIYTVGAYRPLREVVVAMVFVIATLVVMLVGDSPRFAVPEFVTSVPIYVATMLVGWTMQQRRLREAALEREQGAVSARAAADERLRIAQELHDVIGHSLGVIAVQAGVGAHLIDSDPAEAKKALEHISRTSRSSLAEIRRLLGLVRSGEGPASYAPTPGLGDLRRLADEVSEAGLAVELDVAPQAADLPPGIELAGYRIVQEALTNARKHARNATRATVQVEVADGALRIVVTDNGVKSNGGPDRSGGHGLVGMRERVAVYGGTLEVGPASSWGFRVAATLPYDEGPS
jgi:signal transduction histidine kinase